MRSRVRTSDEGGESLFKWLADNSEDIVVVLDEESTVTYINPAVYSALGYTQIDMVGENALSFVHPDDLPAVTAELMDAAASPGSKHVLEMRIRHNHDGWVPFEVVSRSVLVPSGDVRIVVNSRNIAIRKQMEEMKEEFLLLGAH